MELRDRPARERLEFPGRLALEHELLSQTHADLGDKSLVSLYFGGGTPSVLSPRSVSELIDEIVSRHDSAVDLEVTLEANPENLTPQRCEAWHEAGINRLSIGVQSFSPRDLERLERLHQPDLVAQVVGNARDAGIENLSLDLMFGLPDQTPDQWMESLRAAVQLNPDHISFYGLTVHEETPFHDEAKRGTLPLPEEDAASAMYLEGALFLQERGYGHYEISNFARPGRESRHNRRYWTGADVVGIGPGAHSSLGRFRWWNPDDIDLWKESLAIGELCRTHPESLPTEIHAEELLFRGLRTREGIALDGSPAAVMLGTWLESAAGLEAANAEWIRTGAERVSLTLEGWLRSDSILLSIIGASAR